MPADRLGHHPVAGFRRRDDRNRTPRPPPGEARANNSDAPRGRGRLEPSVIDPAPCSDPPVVRVADLPHFGDGVGHLDELGWRVPAGGHHVHMCGSFADRVHHLSVGIQPQDMG
jgi:hypothetical protein